MLENSDGVQYIERNVGDCKQHFYAEGRVQIADGSGARWETLDIWVIKRLVSDNEIEVGETGAVDRVINLDVTPVRVFEIPDEVRGESLNTQRVAPFRIQDENGYADEDYFWNYWEASQAASEFVEDNECDCQIQNAYHNDVEYVEWEEPEEESDDDDYDGPDTLEEAND